MLLLLAASCALPAHATLFSTNTQLTVSSSVAQDGVGSSVAVSADNHTLIFGAPAATVNGIASAGKVYVFTRSHDGTWTQQAVLTEAGTPGSDAFGSSVALSADGNTAVIGARSATVSGQAGAGKVYVFTRSGNTWSEQTPFGDPTPASNDEFGAHVAVSGDAQTLLVGAPGVQSQAGAAFAYTQSNGIWSGPAQLTASDATAKSLFGTVALSADGNTALIGAGSTPINSTPSAGKVYFFTRSNGSWSQSQEFSDPGAGSDEFGTAVALSGDGKTSAVGASYTTVAAPPPPFGTGAGETYIYTLIGGSWSLQQAIPNPLSETGNLEGGFEGNFGVALSLSADGNTALITADQIGAPSSMGQAFAFTRSDDAWKELKEIDDPHQTSRDDFGVSAALNSAGDTAFVGSLGSSGAHYIYVIDSPADLSLVLTADHSVVPPGQSLTYMLTATNNDTEVTATNVTVADTLPSGVTATNVTSGCTGTTGTITCVNTALVPGATYQPSITVAAPANATGQPFNITNNATVNADQIDPDTNNNSASLPVIVLASSGGSSGGTGSGSGKGGGAFGLLSLGLLGFLLGRRRRYSG
ncbi:MAG: isopeptide-forming domain-containing fimbrial protein [Gammaproteobacteria bacterium]